MANVNFANVRIDYNEILNGIGSEIQEVFNQLKALKPGDDNSTLKQYVDAINKIIVSDEQSFMKAQDYHEDNLYIVIRFGGATMNFGASQSNVSLSVLGTANRIKPAQYFMSLFVSYWNTRKLKKSDNVELNITQIWKAPYVSANFNETHKDFRTLFSVEGTLIIGDNAVYLGNIVYEYGKDENDNPLYETLPFMAYNDNYSASVNPVSFGNTNGFAVSEVDFSTFSFSISTYLLDTHLVKDVMEIRGWRNKLTDSGKKPDNKFQLYLSFSNGYDNGGGLSSDQLTIETNPNVDEMFSQFKLVSSSISQRLGEIPSITLSFTLSGLEERTGD